MALTQCDKILRHLQDYGSISQMDALREYGIMRLASRISDLKRQGYPVTREIVAGKNRYGEDVFYARYSLGSGGGAQCQTES